MGENRLRRTVRGSDLASGMRVPDSFPLPPGVVVAVRSLADGAGGLSDAETALMATFVHADRRAAFALGRTAARALLAARLGVAADAVPLAVGADGAPETEGGCVSISHAGRGAGVVAAAAIAPTAVGVDLEAIVPRRPDLWRRMLRADEHALLDALGGPSDRAQTLLWSLKEAVLKGQRTGFRAGARSVRLALDGTAGEVPASGTGTASADASGAWHLAWTDLGGMWLTVATAAS